MMQPELKGLSKIFIFSDRRHNFSSILEKIEKGSCIENTEGGGYPSPSDRKSHFN